MHPSTRPYPPLGYHAAVQIRAITLDLDDTLWDIAPAIERAELALQAWLIQHAPKVASRYPVSEMRRLREQVARENPQLVHDYITQRKLCLERALTACGDDAALAEPAFEVFYAARNAVVLYPEALDALPRLAARWPIAALTNGTANLDRIGIGQHFSFSLSAREHGRAKPEPCIFHAACERLGFAPHEVLHVGDHDEHDVLGAQRAGLHSAWINPRGLRWRHASKPSFTVRHLGELAQRLFQRDAA